MATGFALRNLFQEGRTLASCVQIALVRPFEQFTRNFSLPLTRKRETALRQELAENRVRSNRGDRTPVELFRDAIRGLDASIYAMLRHS